MEIMKKFRRVLNPLTEHQKDVIAKQQTEIKHLKNLKTDLEQQVRQLKNPLSNEPFQLDNIDPDDLVQAFNFDSVVKEIPEGWFVFEMGQSPTTMTWYCQLVEFASLYADPVHIESVPQAKRVMSESKLSATEALRECIYNIEIGSILYE